MAELATDPGSRPVPDPTELTSRAVNALRDELTEIFGVRLDGLKELLEARIDGIDRALDAIERWRLEQKTDSAIGLAAALSAAKEAVGKTETNFNEALKGQRDTFGTAIAAITTRYDDLAAAVLRMESVRTTEREVVHERRDSLAGVYALIGAIGVIVVVGLTVLGIVIANSP